MHKVIAAKNQLFSLVKYYTTHFVPIKSIPTILLDSTINYRLKVTDNFIHLQLDALKIFFAKGVVLTPLSFSL